MDIETSIAYIVVFICLFISSIHYCIIKKIYKVKNITFLLVSIGLMMGIIVCFLANIFFRIPMLLIYIYEEKESSSAAFFTIVLSIISCFALAYFTLLFMSYTDKYMLNETLYDDFGCFALSIGFYPMFTAFFFLIDLAYFYNCYGKKFLFFTGKNDEKVEITGFHTITFILGVISLMICIYNGVICTWFHMTMKQKQTLIKCVLFPALIMTLPLFALILYKINSVLFISIVMSVIGTGLSIFYRIKIIKEYYKEISVINISPEEEDDLVAFTDDRICIENFNKEPKLEIPNSFAGIIFEYKFSRKPITL